MPDIGQFHPVIVHFVVALLFVGVPVRLLALTGKIKFAHPMATTLLIGGTLAAILAVQSGEDAHGPAEAIPGARDIVHHHEETGERARNVFLVVALLEGAALALRRRPRARTGTLVASGVVGLFGLLALSEAAGHGGEVVYEFAGGVGTRFGEPEDVQRLLLAGLYHQSEQDRERGDTAAAAQLLEILGQRYPGEPEVALLRAEFYLQERSDPNAALTVLRYVTVPDDNVRLLYRRGMLTTEAYIALGLRDSAQATLQRLRRLLPENPRVAERLGELGGAP